MTQYRNGSCVTHGEPYPCSYGCRHHQGDELKLLDACQLCRGKRGGVPGNENIVRLAGLDVTVCDYCHAAL